ncbi:tetraspanin [Plakobranchus ocellatus]|uniref:Tetraspanin n=1 Tax=Plakobranchus ocellatus TaxID=259542 RepID=A0AAV4B1A6_9GAST|nr:tetraspanin [Plakobranchus ocellatus]
MAAARELKAFAIIVNLILMMVGGAFVGVGVFTILDNYGMIQLNRIDSDGLYTDMSTAGLLDVAAVLTIVAGCVNFFLGIDGIISVCKEWKCMLALYIGGLVLAVLLEIAILVTTTMFVDRVDDDLYSAIDQGIKLQYEGHIVTENSFSKAFDEAQVKFQCCGLNNYTDFKDHAEFWLDKDSLLIPKSCCHIDEGSYFDNDQYVFDDINCARLPTTQNSHLEKSCFTDIKDWLNDRSYLLLGISIVGAGAELLSLLVNICLLRDVSSSKLV